MTGLLGTGCRLGPVECFQHLFRPVFYGISSDITSSITYSIKAISLDQALKVRENRTRRAAARQGFAVTKSKRRDPNATDYGGYMIVDPNSNSVVLNGDFGAYSLTIEQVEEFLSTPKRRK